MLKILRAIAAALWFALLRLPSLHGYFLRWLDLRKLPDRKMRRLSLLALATVIFVDLYISFAAGYQLISHAVAV